MNNYSIWNIHIKFVLTFGASQVALVVKNMPGNATDIRDKSSIPGLLYNIRAIKSEILFQKNITLIKPSSPSSRPAQPASLYLFLDITRIFNSSHIFINSISFQSPPCPHTQYPGSFALSSSTVLSNFHPWLCCRKEDPFQGPRVGSCLTQK